MKGYNSDEQLINDLKCYIDKYGIPNNMTKIFRSKNGLCSWETYENHLGGKLIDWIKLCGIKLTEQEEHDLTTRGIPNVLTKEDCIEIIKEMQSKLNRPLMYDDFRGSGKNHVGITQVKKYWGTVNKMKKELGLIVNQESMIDKNISTKEQFDNICKQYVDYLRKNNIQSITTKSMDECNGFINYCTFDKKSHEFYNIPITKLLNDKYGIKFGKRGNGKIYKFEDGETTVSQLEYNFSRFLRENGFGYNKTYFRNVRYSKIDNIYNGQMDCDYCIKINNKYIFIELAGILGDKCLMEAYRNDTPIKSKSKEFYRQKLNQKQGILERNNLEYYILLPDEMNEDTYKNILNKYLKEVA